MEKITRIKIEINGLVFNAREAGKKGIDNLVILLHGFPETSLMWEQTMVMLADRGYYAVAPDQRGYSAGARPVGIENYSMDLLAADVIAIASNAGYDSFHLVGHDIGAVVGWSVVGRYPEKVKTWTALSVPDWPAYVWALQNDSAQKEKGAYVKRFQTPGLSEKLIQANDFAVLKKLWAGFDHQTIDAYLTLFADAEALTSVINWYRALFQVKTSINYDSIATDTMLIWGNKDLAIGRSGVAKNKQYMTGDYQFVELNETHWLMEFNNKLVSDLIYEHISEKKIIR